MADKRDRWILGVGYKKWCQIDDGTTIENRFGFPVKPMS